MYKHFDIILLYSLSLKFTFYFQIQTKIRSFKIVTLKFKENLRALSQL